MLRFVAPISLLVLAFAAPSADARGLTLKHASARLRACEQEQHTASFRASTWAWGKGTTLQMRFALQSRTKTDGDWVHSAPPEGFGVWLTANPGVQHYVVDKTLTKLAEGAAYRVVVKFRWRDASGAIVDHGVDRTRPCRQPDRRANLLVDDISILEGSNPRTRIYVVRVENSGATEAPVFATGLEVNDVALSQQLTTEPLVEGDWTELDFEGPPCNAGSSLAATTDTGGSVTESDETDNALTVPCPDSGAPPDVTIGHRL
jgi:hypothetical protein